MRGAFQALTARPGGWTVDELRTKPRPPVGLGHVCGFLLIFVFPYFRYGIGYGIRLNILLFLPPILVFLATSVLMKWVFENLPPTSACVWPRNPRRDAIRKYQETLIIVSMVWLLSIAAFLLCIEFMQYGLGDQWNPFTREIRITKGGPLDGFGIIDMAMFVSGFFAISGLVWWPMYVFFEWLLMKKQAEQGKGLGHA